MPCTFGFGEVLRGMVGFYAKLEKCDFYQFEVEFLGYIIPRDGICIDHRKVQTIVDWVIPAYAQDV